MSENNYIKLASVDVSKEIEKKQNLSYLSWAYAVDKLMRHDPQANWEFHQPEMYGETMMISCTVTAFGKPIRMHLPVMDHRNKAISNPDSFSVNTAMQRCLAKAIALHGLGLSIYAGEDIPAEDEPEPTDKEIADAIAQLESAAESGKKALSDAVSAIPDRIKSKIEPKVKQAIAAKAGAVK